MEIKIGKASKKCYKTGRSFEHGEPVFSVVRMVDHAFHREDYCEDAWTEDLAKNAVAVWSTRFVDPAVEEQEPPESFSPLRKIFYDAVEKSERIILAKAYLAAQLLRRQKIFRKIKEDEKEDGSQIILFVDKLNGKLIEVYDPGLTYSELEKGRQALLEELNSMETPSEEQENNAQQDESIS